MPVTMLSSTKEKMHQNPDSHVAQSNGGDRHIFPLSFFEEELCCYEMLTIQRGSESTSLRKFCLSRNLKEEQELVILRERTEGTQKGKQTNGDGMARAPWQRKKKRKEKKSTQTTIQLNKKINHTNRMKVVYATQHKFGQIFSFKNICFSIM